MLLIGISSNILNVKGHTPENMSLSYNTITDELTVAITHNTANPSTHYIFRVRIWVNASLVNESLYTSQPTTSSFSYIYNINANTGASIQATAYCSISGSITRSLTVGGSNGQTDGQPTISGWTGIIIVVSISVFITTLLILRKIKVKSKIASNI